MKVKFALLLWAFLLPCALAQKAEEKPKLPEKYAAAFEHLKKQRSNVPCDRPVRIVSRMGENTIRVENFICMEADFTQFPKIAGDWANYKSWLLDQINDRPGGGGYFIKFLGVESEGKDQVAVKYSIDIPLFKKERTKRFRMAAHSYPEAFILSGEAVEETESPMAYTQAEMTAYPAPGKERELWVYVEGKTKLKSNLLYAALPEKVLRSESGDRVNKVLENYQAREATLSPGPK